MSNLRYYLGHLEVKGRIDLEDFLYQNNDLHGDLCCGYTLKNALCRIRTLKQNRDKAFYSLQNMNALAPTEHIREELKNIAAMLCCTRYHKDQAGAVAKRWWALIKAGRSSTASVYQEPGPQRTAQEMVNEMTIAMINITLKQQAAELTSLQAQLAACRAREIQQNALVSSLRIELEQSRMQAQQRQDELTASSVAVVQLQQELEESRAQADQQQNEIAESKETVAQLQQELAESRELAARQQKELAASNEREVQQLAEMQVLGEELGASQALVDQQAELLSQHDAAEVQRCQAAREESEEEEASRAGCFCFKFGLRSRLRTCFKKARLSSLRNKEASESSEYIASKGAEMAQVDR
jgi:hypothetical protein